MRVIGAAVKRRGRSGTALVRFSLIEGMSVGNPTTFQPQESSGLQAAVRQAPQSEK